jgi:hypothetical protein
MPEKEMMPAPEEILVPCGRAFLVYYVAIVIFLLGPRFNPNVCLSQRGLATRWRWPWPRHQEITWENLGDVLLRRGLTQSILRVGNLVIEDKSGGPEMFWFGLANPKEVQEEIERRRLRR